MRHELTRVAGRQILDDEMRSALFVIGCLLVAGVIAIGCLGKPRFECAGNSDCTNGAIQGTCQPGGGCSFSDPSCPSGQRYGDLSEMANQCVPLPPDAMIDAYVHDAYVHDARECFGGSGAYELCFDMMPPMGDVNLVGALDTGTDARCMTPPASWTTAGQPDACMILGKTITIGAVSVTGTKALVVVGDTISISGVLDVSSKRTGAIGPGAPFAGCTAFPTAPALNATGAGGGAGASFMRQGGDGGNGDGNSPAGTAPPPLAGNPTILRAGCSGQTGGTGTGPAGAPGVGGGAVFLTASRISFTSSGAINASGAGGTASNMLSGGSGGGSGGMIVLHAAEMITAASGAKLVANGGGGASGANNANVGDSGDDPNVNTPGTQASGGDAGNTAGQGGAGGAGGSSADDGEDAAGNRDTGGGGGGGVGFIQSNRSISNIQDSPNLVVVP